MHWDILMFSPFLNLHWIWLIFMLQTSYPKVGWGGPVKKVEADRQWGQRQADQSKKDVKQSDSSICLPLQVTADIFYGEADYEGQVVYWGRELDSDGRWTGVDRLVWDWQEGVGVPDSRLITSRKVRNENRESTSGFKDTNCM